VLVTAAAPSEYFGQGCRRWQTDDACRCDEREEGGDDQGYRMVERSNGSFYRSVPASRYSFRACNLAELWCIFVTISSCSS